MDSTSEHKGWWALIALLIVTWCSALIGIQYPPDGWYRQLQHPSIAPPDWLFGPVWTLLYLTMAIAAWLVWRRRLRKAAGPAIACYGIQLALNAAWSPLFFGAHRVDLALIDIVLLWLAVLITTILFWRRSRVAAVLFLPYLAWVGFAAILNFEYWRLNG